MEFFLGVLYIFTFLWFLQAIGNLWNVKKENFSINLLLGYVTYTAFQAIGGIISQVLDLNWNIYNYYMILGIIIFLVCISIKNKKREFVNQLPNKLIVHIKNHWMIYILSLILVIVSITNITYHWMGNHLDDGYYLNHIANVNNYPGVANINHGTGLPLQMSFTRTINTFELDAAFWSQLFHISASVFTKYFLSFINYFLILNAIIVLSIAVKLDKKINKVYLQFVPIPLLLFMYPGDYLTNSNLMLLQDGWQFNTAIWYGSSIVRHMGFTLFSLFFFLGNKIDIKKIMLFCFLSITLISRATQAVPAIFLVFISGCAVYLLFSKLNNKLKLTAILAIVIVLIIPNFIIPLESIYITQYKEPLMPILFNDNLYRNITPIFLFASLTTIVAIFKGNTALKKWNLLILFISLLMFVPYLNTVFIALARYDFIASRTATLFGFTIYATMLVNFSFFFTKYFKRFVLPLFIAIGLVICINFFINNDTIVEVGTSPAIGKIDYSLKKPLENIYGIPEITVNLANELEKIAANEHNKIAVLMPTWINYGGTPHTLAILIRSYSPNTLSISAIPRYPGMIDSSPYLGFNQSTQDIVEIFDSTGGKNTDELKRLLEEYPIDYIVVTNQAATDSAISNLDMELASQVYDENVNITMYILKVNKEKRGT